MRALPLLRACALAIFVSGCGSAEGGSTDLDPNGGSGEGGLLRDGGGGGGGGGGSGGGDGSGSGGDGGEGCGSTLTGVARDFKEEHPDFEFKIGDDRGIVQTALGADGKPVWAGGAHPTVTTKESFDQWYRDTPGVNQPLPVKITLTPGAGGVYTYTNAEFFPLDGLGFGRCNDRTEPG